MRVKFDDYRKERNRKESSWEKVTGKKKQTKNLSKLFMAALEVLIFCHFRLNTFFNN